jgi:hypothetical protein
MSLTVISPGVELYLPQCVLAFKHLHVGYRLLTVCSSTAPRLFRDMFHTTDFYLSCSLSRSAHPYGTPSVLSSYSNFYNGDAGGPNGGTA